jgi:predicted acyl esterase
MVRTEFLPWNRRSAWITLADGTRIAATLAPTDRREGTPVVVEMVPYRRRGHGVCANLSIPGSPGTASPGASIFALR